MSRELQCPNCGGPIRMALGSSWAVVCQWCNASVVRTDRDLQTLGKVADLAPTGAEHAVGDSGSLGGVAIYVAGRMQLDHGRGPWDEWYVQHGQHWAWLAKAQGQWYLTYPTQPSAPLPAWEQMTPGQRGQLPGVQGEWVVDEQGHSTVLSGQGELPFPVISGQRGRFVDLSGAGGAFATIDYGDGTQPPKLYVGRRLQHGELQIQSSGAAPTAREDQLRGERLRCPTCGDAVPIRAPQITESAVCGSCNSVLDYSQGKLSFLQKIEQHRAKPRIPLGAEGTIKGEKATCIGYMERYCHVDGMRFRWSEYLLHTDRGYRWLMEDQGHWMWLRPLAGGEVQGGHGPVAKVDGRDHVIWNAVTGHVGYVVGEFYWRVEQGESARLRDFIKPPHVVSQEATPSEVNWTAGEYMEGEEVFRAFGVQAKPPRKVGVGLAQPNPHHMGFPALCALVLTLALFGLMGFVHSRHVSDLLVDGPIPVPPTPSTQPDPTGRFATVTQPFTVREGPTMVEVQLRTNADNQYIGVPAALIEQSTGQVIEFYVDAEHYRGVSGGESWSEGSRSNTEHVNEVPPGTYTLRVDPFWQSFPQPGAYGSGLRPPAVEISVETGAQSRTCLILALLLIWLPAIVIFLRHSAFEKKRQELKTV